MTDQEIFHRQLIASYVAHVAKTPYEEFMVRSELLRRTRELMTLCPLVDPYAKASTVIFFNGDRRAYEDNLEGAVTENPDHVYTIETFPLGVTTLKAISL